MKTPRDILDALLEASWADPSSRDAGGTDRYADADQLAAYIAGTLSEAERDAFEHRLATDDTLRSAWIDLASHPAAALRPLPQASPPPPPGMASPSRRGRQAPGIAWAAAAVLLCGLVLAHAHRAWRPSVPDLGLVARMERVASSLRAQQPDFRMPATAAPEVALPPPPTFRDGLALRLPRGRVLDGRPEIVVELPPGSQSFDLHLRGASPRRVATGLSAGTSPWPASWPAVEPGSSVTLQVIATTPLGQVEASASFARLSDAEISALRTLLDRLDPKTDVASQILAVHVLIERGLVGEAMRRLARLRRVEAEWDAEVTTELDRLAAHLGVR